MKIKISRHAKRRAKLYNIPESVIIDILKVKELSQGVHEIIETVEGFKYPLKIVVTVEDDTITVITNYPFKKGRKNESLLR
ncbi:MAG TPA: hypothetical protein ACFYD7_08740 [Candidatus Wujingus californicus]|uniref:hypothetical protein n=1 Tax=Candidatus Wujingus californicus TaxID=3367618 RepID=UPI001D375DD6|nr:hypothetical protein [Planctomycetota bacterium]MDO8130497.1 hypothetical protein [Candidatus Brocadiales bacterium]